MSFTRRLQQLAKPIWDAQLRHPFVVALGNGTLPKRKFRYYILQDARYLEELARIFALGAQKAQDPDTALRFAKLVEETIVVERGLHETYGKQWKLTATDMRKTPLAPTNYAYCRHMRSAAQTGTLAELTVVALPCAWIYCTVGQHLLQKGPPSSKHPYRDWLLLYGSPEFAEVTQWMRALVDKEAKRSSTDEKERMREAFLTSSRYEWMFWDMAWREEQWPV
ncbi:MAG: thiaminase II [Nitrospira sp. SB0677_bin_15]|nr:thiaminase II [Nitrospira sp. SB0661_bin_20]MYG40288.1 thiaminase II [Nitrospira sp. SB0677_bin_15]MYH02779.1 thiaminase II [Nitrospira sp. SB0675_bin_23]